MKFSKLWLNQYLKLDIDFSLMLEKFIIYGLEINHINSTIIDYYGLLVGNIVEYHILSNTNKLLLIKVNIGKEKLINIICNNFHCYCNMRVIVATKNSFIYKNSKSIKIYKNYSEGKLCSFSELGISNNCTDIIELPSNAPIGLNIKNYLNFNDEIINININLNRADCFSILGISREIKIFYRNTQDIPFIKPVLPTIKSIVPIHIYEPQICPLYCSRIIRNIDVNVNTPFWIKEKLCKCDILPMHVVIDIINYVIIELGQPIFIFNSDYINNICVRYSKKNELINIENKELKLIPKTLIIADYNKILSIAGIINNSLVNINHNTKNIVLNCAFFDPKEILKNTFRYNIHTNISQRYERGVDLKLQLQTIERATFLLNLICGGQNGPINNINYLSYVPKQIIILLKYTTFSRLIGYIIPKCEIINILICMGCELKSIKCGLKVFIPTWRFDLLYEEDLIEEIIRIYGFNNIKNIHYKKKHHLLTHNNESTLKNIKIFMVNYGYQEVITYSFINPKIQKLFFPESSQIILPNPVSLDMSAMRLSLWPGLINTVIYNQNRKQLRMRLFEIGLCFSSDKTIKLGIRQDMVLSGVITGLRFDEYWDFECKSFDFYDIKGDVESIFDFIGKLNEIKFITCSYPALHPAQSAAIYFKNEIIGYMGLIHPLLKNKLNLSNNILLFEIFYDKISNHQLPEIKKISHFPVNRRDISLLIKEEIQVLDVISECKKINMNKLIYSIKLVDIYQGKNIPKGFKNITISLILQGEKSTLTEKDINKIIDECIVILKNKFVVYFR